VRFLNSGKSFEKAETFPTRRYLREDVMINSGSTSLRSYDSVPRPPPPPPPFSVGKLSLFLSLPLRRRSSLLTGKWEGGGGCVAESYDHKKAWASINRAILSEVSPHLRIMTLYGWFHKILGIFYPRPVLWIRITLMRILILIFLFDAD
jgi:hypothetical protein